MQVNPTIFREYDIRGIAGREFSKEAIAEYEKWYGPFPGITITKEIAEAIGRAYGTIIRQQGGKNIVIGHEIRPGAEELKSAFISGVRKTGCNVFDLGVTLTPIVYFMTAYGKYDGGINVTGSHNVYFYNGFKLMKKDVWPLFGKELQGLQEMVQKNEFFQDKEGKYQMLDGYPAYKKYFQEHIAIEKKIKIVIDCGNGSAGVFAPDLFRSLGCEVVELYTEPDATFPNHVPDPEPPQNLKDLGECVVREGAYLGVSFDADGDRVGFVTEEGKPIDADLLLLVFAKDVLSRFPGKKILYDTKCTQLLEELVPRFGGVPVMYRTGHAPIKEAVRKDQEIIFAGEKSGHFFFIENYFKIDDGLFAAARLLELISRKNIEKFSSLFLEFPKRVRVPEIKLPCIDEKKFWVMHEIVKDLGTRFSAVTIDGVRIQVTKTGWGHIRASNTSPYLTVHVEGESPEEIIKIKNILSDELEKFPEITDRLNRKEVATLTGKLGWV